MAPLTWRNVDAPNFSGVAQSLQTASTLLERATGGMQDAIAKRQETVRNGVSSTAMLGALQYTDPEALRGAIASGQFGDPRQLNPEAIRFLGSREGAILENQGTGLRNTGLGIDNQRAQFNLTQGQEEAQRQAGYRANMPEAEKLLVQARIDSQSTDPAVRDRASATLREAAGQGRFTAAGMEPSTALGAVDNNRREAESAITYDQNVRTNTATNTERDRQAMQRDRLNTLVTGSVDLPDALKQIQNDKSLDAETRKQLTADLNANKDTYFPAPTAMDLLPTRGMGPTDMLRQGARGGSPNTPLFNQALRTESGKSGDYNTLYGNAQKQGGRFAGVNPSEMSVGQAIDFAEEGTYGNWVKANNPKGDFATPMGKYQIVGRTLKGAVKEMGLDPNTRFDEQTQDAIAMHIAKKAISGPQTMAGKVSSLRGQWDGCKNLSTAEVENVVRELEGASPSAASSLRGGIAGSFAAGSTAANVPTNVAGNMLAGAVAPPTPPTSILNRPAVQVAGAPATSDNTTAQSPQQEADATQIIAGALDKLKKDDQGVFTDTDGTKFVENGSGGYTKDLPGDVPTDNVYEPKALANARNVQNAAQPVTGTQLLSNAQTVENSGSIDALSNQYDGINAQLTTRPYRELSDPSTIAQRLRGTDKEPGPLASVPEGAVTEAINQIMSRAKVPADVAAVLAQNAKEGRDLGGVLGTSWLSGDRFGNATEGRTGSRIDVDKAVSLMDDFRKLDSDKPGAVKNGVNIRNTTQNQAAAQAQVQQLNAMAAQVQARVNAAYTALQSDPGNPRYQEMLASAQAQMMMINANINALANGGNLTPFTGNKMSQ